MAAVARDAVHRDALAAELRPAAAAVLAAPAALVVVIHHALADQSGVNAGADGMDDTARLVAGDHRPAATAQARLAAGFPAARDAWKSLPHIPDAFMGSTTSPGPATGSGNPCPSNLPFPRKTHP